MSQRVILLQPIWLSSRATKVACFSGSPKSGPAAEILHHAHLCRRASRVFLGRAAELEQAASYLASPPNRRPFLVVGQSGAGKTAFLSKLYSSGKLAEHVVKRTEIFSKNI
jgi:hypothetical protein